MLQHRGGGYMNKPGLVVTDLGDTDHTVPDRGGVS